MTMKKQLKRIIYILLIASVFLCSCKSNTTDKNTDKQISEKQKTEKNKDNKEDKECSVEDNKEETDDDSLSAEVIIPEQAEFSFDSTRSNPKDIYDATGFVSITDVIPDAILEIRYYSTYNFVGDRITGYEEPIALISKEAAIALKNVSDELREQGYRLKIFDAYRPQIAVDHFAAWAKDTSDTRMKAYFYPNIDKSKLFSSGYIAYHSGHSRGCTVDLTLFDMNTGKEVDMGGPFDYFGTLSHPSYSNITTEQYNNRMLLRNTMTKHGFRPCSTEWWDFTLINEPYPNTYFSFPVNSDSLVGN